MILFVTIAILALLIAAYAAGGRKWLKTKPWMAGFFAKIEPMEILLWRKSESILWARFLQGLGLLLTALTALGTFDLSPLFPLLPDKYRWVQPMLPLIISAAGAMNEALRRSTSKPLELVEVPDAAPPRVAAAVATAEATKEIAVAAVKAEEKP